MSMCARAGSLVTLDMSIEPFSLVGAVEEHALLEPDWLQELENGLASRFRV